VAVVTPVLPMMFAYFPLILKEMTLLRGKLASATLAATMSA
jgi:hypothetical protein